MTKEMLLKVLKQLEDCINDLPDFDCEATFDEVKNIADKYDVMVERADTLNDMVQGLREEAGKDYANSFLDKEDGKYVAGQECVDVCELFEVDVEGVEDTANEKD